MIKYKEMERLENICQKTIIYSFYFLFFSVPLVFTSRNYELFEYNKMMLTYALTVIISTFWLVKMAAAKKIQIRRTPFDKFLILFLISQVASTIFSMDVHVSIFGYYSRFHQGLLATISYLILYFAFTANFPKEKIKNILYASFASALIVSLWGILEHFGHSLSCLVITGEFDVNCWVQDVKTRVFATLGQPNWMSAYLAILIPVALGMSLESIKKNIKVIKKPKIQEQITENISFQSVFFIALEIVFIFAFLYTRSRSGFLALAVSLIIFLLLLLKKNTPKARLLALSSLIIFSLCVFIAGSGIAQIDRFTLPSFQKTEQTKSAYVAPALESGGTESGQIRAIVWKGAIDIFRHYPLFGSGVETFAFSYYKFRPAEHNLVSEWDFLYNKAHNEYLNFLATTGSFGFITYIAFIIAFIVWFLKTNFGAAEQFSAPPTAGSTAKCDANQNIFALSLFCGWLTILITNFFGFSVVIIGLYFYLIPAMAFINTDSEQSFRTLAIKQFNNVAIIITLFISSVFLYALYNIYSADLDYAKGSSLAHDGKYKEAFLYFTQASEKNPIEPIYHDELSDVLANLAISFAENKDTASSEKFASLALKESDIATRISPQNVTFYKDKTKMFYTLSALDPSFTARAIDALEKAESLAPTDPKIKYNLGILQSKMNNLEVAISLLESAVSLKPDYRDSRYALALLYKDNGETDKAISELNYLIKINPKDQEAIDKLTTWH